MSSESILVSWRPPSQPNGVITQYTVYTKADNAEEPTSQKVPPNQLTHEASELDKTRRYDFWVTASTNIGEGEASKIVALAPSVRGTFSSPLLRYASSIQLPFSKTITFQYRRRSLRSTTNSRLPTRRTSSYPAWPSVYPRPRLRGKCVAPFSNPATGCDNCPRDLCSSRKWTAPTPANILATLRTRSATTPSPTN